MAADITIRCVLTVTDVIHHYRSCNSQKNMQAIQHKLHFHYRNPQLACTILLIRSGLKTGPYLMGESQKCACNWGPNLDPTGELTALPHSHLHCTKITRNVAMRCLVNSSRNLTFWRGTLIWCPCMEDCSTYGTFVPRNESSVPVIFSLMPSFDGISSPSGTKFAHQKVETLRYHTIKTRSLYITWAWACFGTGTWQRPDRWTDRQTNGITIASMR